MTRITTEKGNGQRLAKRKKDSVLFPMERGNTLAIRPLRRNERKVCWFGLTVLLLHELGS